MPFIVGYDRLAIARHGNFQDKVIGRIRQERSPEEKYVLMFSDIAKKVDKIRDVFFGNGTREFSPFQRIFIFNN